ncbi:MAG: L-threonylcarbamoyladenylate synthase [Myxococcota bacterium]|jgi:L-threonylcarbamoyladenylate synthase|nr:L-threonylcarbamoyladenylate synthase [Myxococcota bacterium]
MRTITRQSLDDSPDLFGKLADVLHDGGLVCFPVGRHYTIAASLMDEGAVIRAVQTKRRARRAPSLVFVPDREALGEVVEEVSDRAAALMDAFWPGPLTILFRPGAALPRKVTRTLAAGKKARLGIRITHEPLARQLVDAFGGPLLITSANVSKKVGSSSLAQVRKNFARAIDVMIEAGDVGSDQPSTVVDPESTERPIVREGAVPADRVLALLTGDRGEV